VPLPVCDHSQGAWVYFPPGGNLWCGFSSFIPTNKQTNKQTNRPCTFVGRRADWSIEIPKRVFLSQARNYLIVSTTVRAPRKWGGPGGRNVSSCVSPGMRANLSTCRVLMMMIAFITFKSSLVPLLEGLWSSNSWEFELSGFRRKLTSVGDIIPVSYTGPPMLSRDIIATLR